MRAAPWSRGFSLVDLIVVLAIVAMVSAIAVPRYASSLGHYRANAAARRIGADLRNARSQAVTSGAAKSVGFDTATNSYTLTGVTDPFGGATPYTVDLTATPYHATLVSAVFDALADPADLHTVIVFDGYGVPDSGGSVVLSVGSLTKTVVVDADTGEPQTP